MAVLVDTKSAARQLLGGHHPTGISTGFLADDRGDWAQLVGRAAAFSLFAAELSALSREELPPLIEFLEECDELPFQYLSVHGPSKGLDPDERSLVAELKRLVSAADSIVMHPDSIDDPELFSELGADLVIENMDRRKSFGGTASELEELFAKLPHAGFCFDIAHAWSVDRSMKVANELLDTFGSRLRQVHVSSLSEEDHHVPLSQEHAELFAPTLARCVDVPWILEAPLPAA
jgi:sugar phosphate isomerase/epimerase